MIEIKVSGFKNQTVEFEQPNSALLFLEELREEHEKFINSNMGLLCRPSPFYSPNCTPAKNSTSPTYATEVYRKQLQKLSSQYPLKIEILEFEDMGDLV